MNLLLLQPGELDDQGRARLRGRRLLHAREVLQAGRGDRLRVGLVGGLVGHGEVLAASAEELLLQVTLEAPPPARPGIDVLLALPRPKALKKVLPALASFGVDRVVLLNAARVEKSFFASPVLEPTSLSELLALGLEQARDTAAPEVLVRKLFKPFVEDELEALFAESPLRLLAHPGAPPLGEAVVQAAPAERVLLAVGPEGGWVPFELELLGARGLRPVSLGERPLRTEVAVSGLLGALLALRALPPRG